jgi:predicted ATP-grasp superfamily ATP-dependent carboligase
MPTFGLILYGCENWVCLKDTNFQNYLSDDIKVVHIWELDHLRWYLTAEDLDLKKIILPLQIYKQQELNYNNIKHVYNNTNEMIDTLDNKKLFVNYAKKIGLSKYIPYVYEKYHSEYKNITKKVIVKEPLNCFGKGISIQPLNQITEEMFDRFVVQEYIYSNIEYDGEFIIEKGKIVDYEIFKKTMLTDKEKEKEKEYFHGGHIPYDAYSFEKTNLDKKYIEILELFLIPSKYNGFCCMDFKIVDGHLKLFEINPRMGGTIASRPWDLARLTNHLFHRQK